MRGFLHRLALGVGTDESAFAALCTDPYCSFVLQSVFQRLGECAPAPDGGPVRDSHGVKMPEIGDLLLSWLKKLGSDLVGMAHQRQASFVLRALLLLFGNCSETKKGETVAVREAQPLPWMALGFAKMFELILEGLNKSPDEVREAARSPAAAAALGTLLAICDENARRGVKVFQEKRDELVCALSFLPPVQAKQSVAMEETPLFGELARDMTGSQLMQRLVQRCHSTHFRTIWSALLLPHARSLATDPSANYVMTAAVERANNEGLAAEAMIPMLEALAKPNLVALFNAQAYKLILAMLKASSALLGPNGSLWRRRLVAQLSGQAEVAVALLPLLAGPIEGAAPGSGGVGMARAELACAVHSMGEEGPAVVRKQMDDCNKKKKSKFHRLMHFGMV